MGALSQSKDTMPKSDGEQQKFDYGMKKSLAPYVYKWLKPSTKIGSGGVIPKSAALGRLMRWPKYVRLQRQRKILLQRLKIPPALNIFNRGCSKEFAHRIVRFCKNYSPESRKQKTLRLRAQAKLMAEGKALPKEDKRLTVKSGMAGVMRSIERGEAKLVIIASDVDPVELVMWMPTLCVKKDIPFVIFKSKARLGTLVHRKTATCLSIVEVRPEDQRVLDAIIRKARHLYNSQFNELKRSWGRQQFGIKTKHKLEKSKRRRKAEEARRRAAIS